MLPKQLETQIHQALDAFFDMGFGQRAGQVGFAGNHCLEYGPVLGDGGVFLCVVGADPVQLANFCLQAHFCMGQAH
ncbi:hypothetical protein D3C75_1187650 [compost metagenome]